MKAVRNYDLDLIHDLQDPEEATHYLNAALEAGDKEAFLLALKNVLIAKGGMTKIANRTQIKRGSLYKMLSSEGNPGFENIMHLLQTVGIRFQVVRSKPKQKRKAA